MARSTTKRPDTCGLVLRIRGDAYAVRPLRCGHRRFWRLRKLDVARTIVHIVSETPWGPVCDCGAFRYRRAGVDPAGCKHIRSPRAVGLLDDWPTAQIPRLATLKST